MNSITKDIFIITCYQYNITHDLVKLLGRENCYLVVDSRPDDFKKFKEVYGDRILSYGRFGYYTIDEALGRLNMIRNLMKVTKGQFTWAHVISQNDLPTAGFFNRHNILEVGKEYVHINKNGWMSNYFTVGPAFCDLLDSNYDKCVSELIDRSLNGWYDEHKGAPSECLWSHIAERLINRINDDLRLYTYSGPGNDIYGIPGNKLGHFTKKTSPVTLDDTEETRKVLSEDGWYLFARKFDYKSPIYNWAYQQALSRL